jgi:hypothetical protein
LTSAPAVWLATENKRQCWRTDRSSLIKSPAFLAHSGCASRLSGAEADASRDTRKGSWGGTPPAESVASEWIRNCSQPFPAVMQLPALCPPLAGQDIAASGGSISTSPIAGRFCRRWLERVNTISAPRHTASARTKSPCWGGGLAPSGNGQQHSLEHSAQVGLLEPWLDSADISLAAGDRSFATAGAGEDS